VNRSPATVALLIALAGIPARADHIEELVVTARHDKRTIDVSATPMVAPDPAQLLRQAPGANVNSNGPLSGIAQYRGMYGPRIATTVNGNAMAGAGPNYMDPPLSYSAGQLASLEIYRGIAPVSVAQESIGGAIEATLDHGEFAATADPEVSGRLRAGAQSASSGHRVDGALYLANARHRLNLGAMTERGDNAEFAGGTILPTEYRRERYDLGYALQAKDHRLQLDYMRNETGDAGTPALPMDIQWIDGDLLGLTYNLNQGGDIYLEARLYGSDLDHGMTNYHLRAAPADPMMHRRNVATADTLGFSLAATVRDDRGDWQVGVDGFEETHDADIDNPNNPTFFIVNFNGAERQVLGLFAQRRQELGDAFSAEFGLRYNRVRSDADEVDGTPALMAGSPGAYLRDSFNNAQREQTDHNIDAVAKLWYRSNDSLSLYGGIARKSRSPSYQERYLWLPLQATGGLADGFSYTGTIDLKPEVAHELELGADFSDGRLTLSPRLFWRDVDNYIQGTVSSNVAAIMLVRMMNMQNGTNNPDPLMFTNVDARLYGFDMDWAWQLDEQWSVSGLLSYVRGERDDINDNLYRISPDNATLALNYDTGRWSAGVETVLYARQDKVSEANAEQQTPGYGVVNLRGSWRASEQLQLSAGIDNLFDNTYREHLGGYNRVVNPDIARGERLPGYGTNAFVQLHYTF
jgi:iron complex outermembrane receptor protein